MQIQTTEMDDLAVKLEATGDFKVLRRLAPRPPVPMPAGYTGKIGIILDLETTGLDPTKDEVIELALVKLLYADNNEIIGVSETFQSFNQPSAPIPAPVVELTHITDEMVAGCKIDRAALETFVADADIVIAHNASFDRKFAERFWPLFQHLPWACSQTEIDWRSLGFGGTKLTYLLADAGYFHGAHRAIDDCQAVLELLSKPLPAPSTTAFALLLDRARHKIFRIWAQNSPFDLKNILKSRGYRWSDGSDGRLKSWYIDVDASQRDSELNFLKIEIYQRDIDILWREITALDRFSNRT
jgi:DNA polymerase-3 subunit epsilon